MASTSKIIPPKLAMLEDDGTLLKSLEVSKNDVPESVLGTLDGKGKGAAVYIAPVQFVGQGHSIYVVQNKTDFPILEVSEAGEIREIHPKLPADSQVKMLVPSDNNLYAQVGERDDHYIAGPYKLNCQVLTLPYTRFTLPIPTRLSRHSPSVILNPATINEDPICFSENCVEAKTCTQRKCF